MKRVGFVFICIGLAALAWERFVVSGVDQNGVLQESLALLLGWLLLALGGLLLSLHTILQILGRKR